MDRKAWIVVTLCVIGIFLNFWYTAKYPPPPPPKPVPAAATPGAPGAAAPPVPGASVTAAAPGTAPAPVTAASLPEETHTLHRGNVTWHFTNKGGGVAYVALEGTDKVHINDVGSKIEPIGALRDRASGSDNTPYQIVEKTDKSVTFEGTTAAGIKVRKAYSLTDGDKGDEHLIALNITLTNTSPVQYKTDEYYIYTGAAMSLRPDEVLKPSAFWNDDGSADQVSVSSFAGGWFSAEKMEHTATHSRLRYAGVMSRFHATIVNHISQDDKSGRFWATRFLVNHSTDKFKDLEAAKHDYAIQAAMGLPPMDLAPGAVLNEKYEIYAGPKEYHRLARLEGERDGIMFYGWTGWISKPMNNIMRWMHDVSGNWGVAIVLMTLCIRTLLWPLQSKAQYSMKRMSLLAPKMKELQAKYKDDPQKQQMETMKLYRDYGVNPVGGCLPMMLQIPIFFGFYGVLQNAAELRGQPFFGWVKDLSMPDTLHTFNLPFALPLVGNHLDLNPLPLIMGVTMILQMKLTPQPATMDKSQKIMFTIMPFFFLIICYNFAAALALYWSTQNIYAIFQSWAMRLYMKDPVLEKVDRSKPKGPAGPSLFGGLGGGGAGGAGGGDGAKKPSKNKPPKLGG